jgi:Ni/Co efflux regulator RcnB
MKSLVLSLLAASALALPIASFAQDANQPVTRAQVRADLVRAEQQGTVPLSKTHYPPDQNMAQRGGDENTGYGPSTYGSAQSSSVIPLGPQNTLFSHH